MTELNHTNPQNLETNNTAPVVQLSKRFPKSDANKDGKLDDAELRALRDFFETRRNDKTDHVWDWLFRQKR